MSIKPPGLRENASFVSGIMEQPPNHTLSESERAFIEFYTSMSNGQVTQDAGKDYFDVSPNTETQHQQPQQQQQQQQQFAAQSMDASRGASTTQQAVGSSPGLTVVTPTQATVQRARKQTTRRLPVKARRKSAARQAKSRMQRGSAGKRRASKKTKTSSTTARRNKRKASVKRKTAAMKRARANGRTVAKSKIQKRRVQKGAGRRNAGDIPRDCNSNKIVQTTRIR